MKIQILGSGGFTTTPKPLCKCKVCTEARNNPALQRTGPSFYVDELDLLIDLPVDTKTHLDRIGHFPKNITFSHWHPDHTEGCRSLELYQNNPSVLIPKDSGLIKRVPALQYLHGKRVIKLKEWQQSQKVTAGDTKIQHIVISNKIPVCAFFIEQNTKTALIVPDHSKHLLKTRIESSIDLLIMNMGSIKQVIGQEITTFDDNLEIIQHLKPQKTVLTHIEENFGITLERKKEIEEKYNIHIALDNDFVKI